MKQRTRIYYSDAQKAVMWERWKQGSTLHRAPRARRSTEETRDALHRRSKNLRMDQRGEDRTPAARDRGTAVPLRPVRRRGADGARIPAWPPGPRSPRTQGANSIAATEAGSSLRMDLTNDGISHRGTSLPVRPTRASSGWGSPLHSLGPTSAGWWLRSKSPRTLSARKRKPVRESQTCRRRSNLLVGALAAIDQ
jgi:hypothetical protein